MTSLHKYLTAALLYLVLSAVNQPYSQDNPFYAPDFTKPYLNTKLTHPLFVPGYDTIYGYWGYIEPVPQALFCINAYYWQQNNKVFVCGGANSSAVPSALCWWYNTASNTYETAAPLPQGRWGGKLVRVKDSLYLVGSVDSTFSSADGLIFKYSLNQNTWVMKGIMNLPFVHESAVCVINDSLIMTIGGSTNSFTGTTSRCRLYNPRTNVWNNIVTTYPANVTSAHAEFSDTTGIVVVLGGYNAGALDAIYSGLVILDDDSTEIEWGQLGSTIFDTTFGAGAYRVAGAKWNDYMLFGPAMNGSDALNRVVGLRIHPDTTWFPFVPETIDTIGNISTFGVKGGTDSNYFFLFGGFKNPNVVATAQKYTFATPPPPIGIVNIGGNVPEDFALKQNYPNPFNPVTNFEFHIAEKKFVSLKIYDLLGREIALIVNSELKAGIYKAEFNASHLPSGVYFYRLSAGNFSQTKKMILIK